MQSKYQKMLHPVLLLHPESAMLHLALTVELISSCIFFNLIMLMP